MENADDIVRIVAAKRNARIRALERQRDVFARLIGEIEQFDRFAVNHDFLDADFVEIKGGAEQIAHVLVKPAFLMVQIDGAAQFVGGGEHLVLFAGVEADELQRAAHEHLHDMGDWREDQYD